MKNKHLKMVLLVCSMLVGVGLLQSCKQKTVDGPEPKDSFALDTKIVSEADQAKLMKDFAITLHKLCEAKEVREILINEARREFDSNYDVLYQMIKDRKLKSGHSLRDEAKKAWDSFSFEFSFESLENSLPLLNIHVPDFELVGGLSANDWDANNKEYATAYQEGEDISMIVGDDYVPVQIEKGDIPSLMTFFVNINKRLVVKNQTLRSSGESDFQFDFIYPELDRSKRTSSLRNQWVDEDKGDEREYFYPWDLGDDVGKAFYKMFPKSKDLTAHRALLYYGDDHTKCNRDYNEYLLRFKIDPKSYRWFTGKDEDDDPKIKEGASVVTYKQKKATINQIIETIWTKGNFMFSFDIKTPLKNGGVETSQLIFSVSPKDLFVMNPSRDRKHPTWFSRTKYTYKLHVDSLASKWVYPHKINGGEAARISKSWDLDKVALFRKIYISERDKSKTSEKIEKVTSTFVSNVKLAMDIAIPIKGIPLGFKFGYGANNTYSKEYNIKRNIQDGDDDLGEITLYFDDPIVKDPKFFDDPDFPADGVKLNNLSNGTVTITVVPGKKPIPCSWL